LVEFQGLKDRENKLHLKKGYLGFYQLRKRRIKIGTKVKNVHKKENVINVCTLMLSCCRVIVAVVLLLLLQISQEKKCFFHSYRVFRKNQTPHTFSN